VVRRYSDPVEVTPAVEVTQVGGANLNVTYNNSPNWYIPNLMSWDEVYRTYSAPPIPFPAHVYPIYSYFLITKADIYAPLRITEFADGEAAFEAYKALTFEQTSVEYALYGQWMGNRETPCVLRFSLKEGMEYPSYWPKPAYRKVRQ
jgi:hypothetical protein